MEGIQNDFKQYCIELLNFITETKIDNRQWKLAMLPISKGGLGFTELSTTGKTAALAAKIAIANYLLKFKFITINDNYYNTLITTPIADYWEDLDRLKYNKAQDFEISKWTTEIVNTFPPKIQYELNKRYNQIHHDLYLANLEKTKNIENIKIFKSQSFKHSGKWLYTIPANKSTLINNKLFVYIMKLRLNIPFPKNLCGMKCRCQKSKIKDWYHCLTCKVGGYIQKRHDNIAKEFYQLLLEADEKPKLSIILQVNLSLESVWKFFEKLASILFSRISALPFCSIVDILLMY